MNIKEEFDLLDDELEAIKVDNEEYDTAIADFNAGKVNASINKIARLINNGVPNVLSVTIGKIFSDREYLPLKRALYKINVNLAPLTDRERLYLAYAYALLPMGKTKSVKEFNNVALLAEPEALRGDIRAIALIADAKFNIVPDDNKEEKLHWAVIGGDRGASCCSYLLACYYYELYLDTNDKTHQMKVKEYLEEARKQGYMLNSFEEFVICTEEELEIHNGTSVFMEKLKKSNEFSCIDLLIDNLSDATSQCYNPAEGIKECERMIELLKQELSSDDFVEDEYNNANTIHRDIERCKGIIKKLRRDLYE